MPNPRYHGPLASWVVYIEAGTAYRWNPHAQAWSAHAVTVTLVDPPAPPALVWEGDYA